jgi:hypothetical protein
MATPFLPKLNRLPIDLPEGAVRIDLVEGVPIFRASSAVQGRIETLLDKQVDGALSANEEQELDYYAEIDDHLSFMNRTVRNLSLAETPRASYQQSKI